MIAGISASALSGMDLGGRVLMSGMLGSTSSVMMGGEYGHGFISAGLGSLVGRGDKFDVGGLITSAVVGGTISEMTGGKFKNGAASAAFSYAMTWAAKAYGVGGAPTDDRHKKIGECAKTNKCSFNDFTPEERASVQKRLDEASTGFLNKPNDSADDAALLLHNSEVKKIADQLGIEVWARISGKDHSIYMVSTGFDNGGAWGAVVPGGGINMGRIRYKDSVRHTHPSGLPAHTGDLGSILQDGGAAIYASGVNLSKFNNSNFIQYQGMFIRSGVTYTGYEYISGQWVSYQRKSGM